MLNNLSRKNPQTLAPMMIFSEAKDGSVGSPQATLAYTQIQQLLEDLARVHLFVHPAGHDLKGEVPDEAAYLQTHFNLRLRSLRR